MSYKGTASTQSGAAQAHGGPSSPSPARRLATAKKKPRNVLPASPRKMRARGKLNHKNPATAPMKMSSEPAHGCIAASGTRRSTAAAMNATPPDNASMLSSKLKALTIPTIQKMATGGSQPFNETGG